MLPNNNIEFRFNKHLHVIKRYGNLKYSLIDYFYFYGLDYKRISIPTIDIKNTYGLNIISISKKVSENNYYLFLKLIDLLEKYGHIILILAFEDFLTSIDKAVIKLYYLIFDIMILPYIAIEGKT